MDFEHKRIADPVHGTVGLNIAARHLVLWVIAAVEAKPNGKTYLQKMCFFVGQILGVDLGHRAHYYGPYSDQVSAEIGFLNANGYVFESRNHSGMADNRGWEVTRCDYQLTDRGTQGVQWLDAKYPADAKRVREAVERVLAAGDLNYIGLSFAAKTFWILSREGQPITFERIADKASHLRWTVGTENVKSASDFLQRLNLATVTGP